MRRTIVAVTALALAATLGSTSASTAADDAFGGSRATVPDLPSQASPTAQQALDKVQAILDGRSTEERPNASMAMLDLFRAKPQLAARGQVQADALLARPTQGASDPQGDGYTVPAVKKCTRLVCLHWVKSTADAPPSAKWARKSLRIVHNVYKFETRKLGYKRPPRDGKRGGNKKFDFYLKNIGAQNLYGYCAPEKYVPGSTKRADSYCVLDNDFSKAEFPTNTPTGNLKVTAAHEFFHGVQFGYDVWEDRWLYESTSTWMEERFADDVNDNRNYLPYSQVYQPPYKFMLDYYASNSLTQYGNWTFWEYWTQRKGRGFVKKVWNRAAKGDTYSTQAVVGAFGGKAKYRKAFAQYATGASFPKRSWAEGKAWPAMTFPYASNLTRSAPSVSGSVTPWNNAYQAIKITTDQRKKAWKLRVTVDAFDKRFGSAVTVTAFSKSGKLAKFNVKLNRRGNGKFVLKNFGTSRTRYVVVTAVNASTRYKCNQGWPTACQGEPKDGQKPIKLTMKLFR